MAHDTLPSAIPFRTLGPLTGGVKAAIAILVLIGVAALALSAGADDHGRVWKALHFNWLFWNALSMGMVMFAVALHITNAQWAWSIRRFALGGAAFLPIAFVPEPLVVLLQRRQLGCDFAARFGDPALANRADDKRRHDRRDRNRDAENQRGH